MVEIRKATLKDVNKLYYLGSITPELQVSDEPFMTKKGFEFAVKNPKGVFLVAEEKTKVVGFAYGNIKNKGKGYKEGCLVYLVVHPKYRKKGIGKLLYDERLKQLKKRGVSYVYSWIGVDNKRMHKFSKKHGGLKLGKKFIYCSKEL